MQERCGGRAFERTWRHRFRRPIVARAFRRAVLEGIDYAGVASQGYCFQIDLARRALDAGYRVVEVPITFVERERGESKMDGTIVREALTRVTQWGVAHRRAQLRAAMYRKRPGSG